MGGAGYPALNPYHWRVAEDTLTDDLEYFRRRKLIRRRFLYPLKAD